MERYMERGSHVVTRISFWWEALQQWTEWKLGYMKNYSIVVSFKGIVQHFGDILLKALKDDSRQLEVQCYSRAAVGGCRLYKSSLQVSQSLWECFKAAFLWRAGGESCVRKKVAQMLYIVVSFKDWYMVSCMCLFKPFATNWCLLKLDGSQNC